MHIYRVHNSLCMDEYKFNSEQNAFFLGGMHATNIVDKVGDLALYYSAHIDDSDWIEPHKIKDILLSLKKVKEIDGDESNKVLDLIKNEEVQPGLPQINGEGYTCYDSIYLSHELRSIDIVSADWKSAKHYMKHKKYSWLSKLSKSDFEVIEKHLSKK